VTQVRIATGIITFFDGNVDPSYIKSNVESLMFRSNVSALGNLDGFYLINESGFFFQYR